MAKERRRSLRDKIREDAQDSADGGSGTIRLPEGFERCKVEKGTMEFDVLCYEVKSKVHPKAEPGELFYRREFKVHHQIGAEKKSYICLTSVRQRCPICEYRDELAKDYKANEKLIADLKPQVKDLYYIDPDGKGKNFEVLEYSHHNFTKKLLEEVREGDEDWAAFADLEQGYTLKARFSEESFAGNKYLECTRVDFSTRDDYPEAILDDLPDMDEMLVVLEYDKLNSIFLELDEEGGGDDRGRGEERGRSRDRGEEDRGRRSKDEEESPARGRRERSEPEPEKEETRSRRGRSEETKEESPPARSRRSRSEPEPEPEKEESPARGRRGSSEADDNPCPNGFEYGADADKNDECQKCGVWEKCMDRRDEIEAEQRSAGGGRRRS